jgi:glycosyltransferase involved in cell wall biosynthesis
MNVSIIMPAYNREQYLAAAIDSVLAQTYQDWELIVVDDGSTDSSPVIAQAYAREHPGRVIFERQENAGPTAARNNGIRRAGGRLIAFLDSDDLWVPTKLERQVPVFDSPDDVAFVYTGYELVDESGRLVSVVPADPCPPADIREMLWTQDNHILGGTMMIEREKLIRVGLFDERLKGIENLDLRLKLATLGRVAYVDEILYKYRKHGASLTDDHVAMMAQFAKLVRLHFGDAPLTGGERRLWRAAMSNYWYRCGNLAFERKQFVQAASLYCRAWQGSRRKSELCSRIVRCVAGRPGNTLIRGVKQISAHNF